MGSGALHLRQAKARRCGKIFRSGREQEDFASGRTARGIRHGCSRHVEGRAELLPLRTRHLIPNSDAGVAATGLVPNHEDAVDRCAGDLGGLACARDGLPSSCCHGV